MTNSWRKILLAVLLLAALLILSACSQASGGAELLGQWTIEEGNERKGYPQTVIFNNDGSCTADGIDGTYRTEGGRIYFTWNERGSVQDYFDVRVSGNTMTLQYDIVVNYNKA